MLAAKYLKHVHSCLPISQHDQVTGLLKKNPIEVPLFHLGGGGWGGEM